LSVGIAALRYVSSAETLMSSLASYVVRKRYSTEAKTKARLGP
jgi:hypothetical protein